MSDTSSRSNGQQLVRLQRLTDVVYGIVIWQLFMLIPTPDSVGKEWDSVAAYLAENGATIFVILLGVAWAIVYWLQSNQLLGVLSKSDAVHSAFSILQLFFLFAFLYSMMLGVELGGSPGTWAFESGMATAIGGCSALAFRRARRRGLLLPEVSAAEAKRMAIRYRAEPLTAAITIPFAFVGGPQLFGFGVVWELSWLIYPLVASVMGLLARRATQSDELVRRQASLQTPDDPREARGAGSSPGSPGARSRHKERPS